MKIKVCGMKHEENILAIAAAKPDYLGFIFYEKSPRNFEGTIPELPECIQKVGVFVNERIEVVLKKVKQYSLQVVQLHGEESKEYCQELKHYLPDLQIIKVFGVKNEFDFTKLTAYEQTVDFFLFDTKGQHRGGNGVVFNWELLKDYSSAKPFFLSGGIGLDNMQELNRFLESDMAKHCQAIDVNSKFEIEAGLKSVQDVEQFIQEINERK